MSSPEIVFWPLFPMISVLQVRLQNIMVGVISSAISISCPNSKIEGAREKRQYPIAPIREDIYQHILFFLRTEDEEELKVKTEELEDLANAPRCPKKMGMISRELLRKAEKYRAYLNYHDYTIPRTTSPAESVGKLIRKRTKTLRTPGAVQRWATAFMRLRKK